MPATPSPHRFLPGRRQPSPPKTAKATPSGLRHQLPANVGDAFDQPKPRARLSKPAPRQPPDAERGDGFGLSTPKARPPAAQFAQTPRFSHGRPAQTPTFLRQPSPPKQNFVQALRQRSEDVQEAHSQNNEDDEMLELEHDEAAVPATESFEPWQSDLPHSPKRRKVDESPARPAFKHPTTPASHAPQFTRASTEETAIHRPAFLRSSVAPTDNYEPPPEAFSPHRRGEKFVPGGMAATLQQWVVETGQAAAHSRKGQGYLRGENYVLHVKLDSVSGSQHPVFVSGRQQDGGEVRLMLIVDGKNRPARIEVGCVVGVRAPVWEVDIDGVSWTVGVDWKVVQSS